MKLSLWRLPERKRIKTPSRFRLTLSLLSASSSLSIFVEPCTKKKNPESSNSPFIGWSPTLIRLLYDPYYWTWPLLKLSWESFRSFGNQMMPTLPYFLGTRWVDEYLRSLVLHRSKIILKQNIEKRKNRSVWPFVLGNICVGVNLHFFFLLKFLR